MSEANSYQIQRSIEIEEIQWKQLMKKERKATARRIDAFFGAAQSNRNQWDNKKDQTLKIRIHLL